MTDHFLSTNLEECIVALLSARAVGASICPSEVARAVARAQGENWRDLMVPAREVAMRMARFGRIQITRKGEVLDPQNLGSGPIRLRWSVAHEN